MATLPAALTDDLLQEFFLRLPPEDPASLITAALVCKRWRRILADRCFRRRFCEHHHRKTPLLGYFRQGYGPRALTTRMLFTPTSSLRPRNAASLSFKYALDSRHGRVLVSHVGLEADPSACRLAVWDPITDDLLSLPRLPQRKPTGYNFTWNAVLLCASSGLISTAAGCGDFDCHRGPFLVVFIGAWQQDVYAYVYSSETGAWSHTTSAAWDTIGLLACTVLYHNETRVKAVYGNAVYFKLVNHIRLLKYDLGAKEISSVDLPDRCRGPQILLLTASEYGGLLGVAAVAKLTIELWWSSEAGPDRRFGWEPALVIELPKMPHSSMSPLAPLSSGQMMGYSVLI